MTNGGLTRTHAPNPGSPAINRGGTCPATDQTGLFRYIAAPCDAGSVEIGATATPPPVAQTPPTPAADAHARPATARRSAPRARRRRGSRGKVKCVKKKRKKK